MIISTCGVPMIWKAYCLSTLPLWIDTSLFWQIILDQLLSKDSLFIGLFLNALFMCWLYYLGEREVAIWHIFGCTVMKAQIYCNLYVHMITVTWVDQQPYTFIKGEISNDNNNNNNYNGNNGNLSSRRITRTHVY